MSRVPRAPGDDSEPTSFLAGRAKREGSEVFAKLYERVAPAVYAWAELRIRPSIRSMVDPEDVTQEVWCRAFRRFPDYDPAETPFPPWVFRIANYVLLEAFKSLKGRPLLRGRDSGSSFARLEAVPDEATSISRRVARDEVLRRFLDRVSTLEAEDVRLFVYRGLEGLSHAEVAERLQLGEDTIRKRWQRLRDKLIEMKLPDELIDAG